MRKVAKQLEEEAKRRQDLEGQISGLKAEK